MKNIKDLGANECVWLPTRKKALKFLRHIGKTLLISKWNEENKYYFPGGEYFATAIPMDATLYKISDFISSKPSIKKRLKKAESEIRRLNDLLPEHLQNIESTVESEKSIEPNSEQEIDWSIPGQLVEYRGLLVKTSGYHDPDCFSGQVQVSCFWKEGHISSYWLKSAFKLSNKTQTIK